jgi:hypothetical protein
VTVCTCEGVCVNTEEREERECVCVCLCVCVCVCVRERERRERFEEYINRKRNRMSYKREKKIHRKNCTFPKP